MQLLRQLLESRRIPVSMCVGLATDHARAMTGKDNGLAALVNEIIPPIPVHCIAHCLVFPASQSAKDVP